MTKFQFLLIAIAVFSFIFIRITGIYLSIGELVLGLVVVMFPRVLNYQRGSITFKALILGLILYVLLSEVYAGSDIADGLIFFLRFFVFMASFYIACFLYKRLDPKLLFKTTILILISLAMSSLLGFYFFRDGYLDFLLGSEANINFNGLWKFSHAQSFTFIVFTLLLITRYRPLLFAIISGSFGLLNFYFDTRSLGVIFMMTSMFTLARQVLPRARIALLAIIPLLVFFAYYAYLFVYDKGIVSQDAASRYQFLANQRSSESVNILDTLNRSSLNSSINEIRVSPVLGSGTKGLATSPFSSHSVLFFYWALWGLAFPLCLFQVIIVPAFKNFNLFLSSRLVPTAAPFSFLLLSIVLMNLLLSPLASYRVVWGVLSAILVSISPTFFLSSKN